MAARSVTEQDFDYGRSPICKRMYERYKTATDAEGENRDRGLEALKFRNGEQYSGEDITRLKADNRPYDVYNQIPQFIHKVTNNMRANMAQTRFIAGTDADEEVAEVYEDLARAIQASSEGETAYDIAADMQVTIGWGYWRYITEYENDKSFDQVIKIKQVRNPFTIYDDPHAQAADRLDRRWLIEITDVSKEDFNSEYDRDYDSFDLDGIGNSCPDWATNKTVRVAEYWEVTDEVKYLTRDGVEHDEKPKGVEANNWRRVTKPKVMWYKCTAKEVLEKAEWPGKFIPYVKVIGEELNIDGKVVLSGLVEAMMPGQRQYNYMSNKAREMVALAPNSPWLIDIQSVQGFEKYWSTSNVKNWAYLPYNGKDKNGQELRAPSRSNTSADINAALAMVQQAQQNLYTTTGIYPASLGQASNETSGKAINARKVEGDISNFHYPDNMARAQRAGGVIMEDLIPKIYDGSREIDVMKEDRSTRKVKVNQEFEEKGRKKKLDLTVGTYSVMVTTGPSYTTRRQESAEAMLQLAQSTNLMEVAPDKFYKAQDWPGAEEIAKRYEFTPVVQQLKQAEEQADGPDEKIPPQVEQAMAAAAQQIDGLNAALQDASQQLQTAQADNAAKMADVQNKQADLQLKAQQMQLTAAEQERADQLKMMEIELKGREVAIKEQQLQLEFARLQVEATRPAETAQAPAAPQKVIDPNDKNALLAQVQTLEEGAAMEAQQREMENQLKVAEIEQQAQGTQATLEAVSVLAAEVAGLKQAILAPKMVVRDANGNLAGVVTDANQA